MSKDFSKSYVLHQPQSRPPPETDVDHNREEDQLGVGEDQRLE